MKLSSAQRKHLRSLAHHLKPVVTIGDKGISAGVLEELKTTLEHHELIKVKIRSGDKRDRDAKVQALTEQCAAELVGRVGNVATIYRPRAEQPSIKLP